MELTVGPKVIVDLSWVMYRSYYTFPNFSFIDNKGKHVHTGGIYGVLRQHLAIMEEFPTASYHYCIEPETNYRYNIDPNYKAGREHTEESKASTYGMLAEILSMLKLFLRTSVWTAVTGEADDVIYTLAQKDPLETHVYSADNDLLPLLSKGVKIFRALRYGVVTYLEPTYIKGKFGVEIPPDSVPLYKIIRGDASDNIPSVFPRFPTKVLEGILNKCKTVDELMVLESTDSKIMELKAVEPKMRHNEKLVLLQNLDIYEPQYEAHPPRYFITNYGLKTIRKAFPDA